MRSIIMQGMELIPAPSMEKETTGSLLQYSPSSLFLSEVGESALQETTHSDGGAHEVNHDAEHVMIHLLWYGARPRAVYGRRYSLRSAPILSSIAVLSEVGGSPCQGWVDKRQVTG